MECHSIQFTTISINVERGIVKILFKYRYFQDLLIDIDIDIDISQILLIDIDIDIDIFQNHHIDIDIDIDIFGIALSISIFFRIALSISIFSKMTISILISISIFFKSVNISTIDMSYRYIEQGYVCLETRHDQQIERDIDTNKRRRSICFQQTSDQTHFKICPC